MNKNDSIFLQTRNNLLSSPIIICLIIKMDKPFKQITSLKSNEDLREYLQKNRNLNLSLMIDKNNANLLHFAAFKNDLVKMKIFFQHYKAFCEITHGNKMYETGFETKVKSWINTANDQGLTALHFAALHGNIEMLSLLQSLGANMEFITKEGENVLFMSVQNNEIKTLIYLIEESRNRIDLNAKNQIGDNILHKAARNNCISITSYLLTKSINPNEQNNEGFTPLMQAVMASNKQIVKSLLVKGVDRHIKNKEQQQAIDIARAQDRKELVIILNDEFTFGEKIKIACNVKIVYRAQKQSYLYAFFFILIYHIVFLPTCLMTEFTPLSEDKFYYPIIGQSIYYLLTIIIYILLLRKHKKKIPLQSLMNAELPFCSQCRNQKRNEYHCFVCETCVYRYDHHCPWINNCISVNNIGKFYAFLWLIELGTIFVIFCHLCMLGMAKNLIRYRQFTGMQPEEKAFSILCLLLSGFFAISIFLIILQQTKNLSTNTTQFQRSRVQKKKAKASVAGSQSQTLLSEQNLSKSFLDKSFSDQQAKGCLGNCKQMLFGSSEKS